MEFRYIAVEGPPGVGKTELARRLALELDGASVLEQKNNPFLQQALAGQQDAGRHPEGLSLARGSGVSPRLETPASVTR